MRTIALAMLLAACATDPVEPTDARPRTDWNAANHHATGVSGLEQRCVIDTTGGLVTYVIGMWAIAIVQPITEPGPTSSKSTTHIAGPYHEVNASIWDEDDVPGVALVLEVDTATARWARCGE